MANKSKVFNKKSVRSVHLLKKKAEKAATARNENYKR
jgi:hypothetical protein